MDKEELSQAQLRQLVKLLRQQKKQLVQQLDNSEADVQPVTLDQQSVGRVSRIDAIQQQQMAIASREQDKSLHLPYLYYLLVVVSLLAHGYYLLHFRVGLSP